MMRLLSIVLVTCIALPAWAAPEDDIRFYAKPMVADISQDTIQIHAQFDGASLLLYGARNEPGDVVAVVTGPLVDVQLSRKDNIAGMWMQVERANYAQVPLFFAVAATRPLGEILGEPAQATLGMRYPDVAQFLKRGGSSVMNDALKEKLAERRWIAPEITPIHYFGETLFRTHLDFPNNMPRGDYTVDIFLVHAGRVTAMQTIPLHAQKTGLDFWLYDISRSQPWLYGLCAALLSLLGGWLGNRLVRR